MRWYVGNQWGYIFGLTGFVFLLGLAVPAFGSFLFVFVLLSCVCVLSAFILQMFLALLCGRIFGLRFPSDLVFYNPLQVLFRMLLWLAELPILPLSIFLLTTDGDLGHENMASVFPASPFRFAFYLRHLMTEAKTASPLESAVHSITWVHQLGGEPSPSDHPLVKSILAGAQRLLAHRASKKEPLTVSQLEQL